MSEQLPLHERQIEIRKGLYVDFTYPPQRDSSSTTVPVLVDFKKFMQLSVIDLGKMPSRFGRWWRKIAPRDEYEAKDMERYAKINRGIHQYGEMEMPEIVYPAYDGKIHITEGRHRLRAFEGAGAEKILVLVKETDAPALRAAVGWQEKSRHEQTEAKSNPPQPDADTQWAEQVRKQREAFEAQKDAARKAGTSSKGILGNH